MPWWDSLCGLSCICLWANIITVESSSEQTPARSINSAICTPSRMFTSGISHRFRVSEKYSLGLKWSAQSRKKSKSIRAFHFSQRFRLLYNKWEEGGHSSKVTIPPGSGWKRRILAQDPFVSTPLRFSHDPATRHSGNKAFTLRRRQVFQRQCSDADKGWKRCWLGDQSNTLINVVHTYSLHTIITKLRQHRGESKHSKSNTFWFTLLFCRRRNIHLILRGLWEGCAD